MSKDEPRYRLKVTSPNFLIWDGIIQRSSNHDDFWFFEESVMAFSKRGLVKKAERFLTRKRAEEIVQLGTRSER